MAEIHEVNFPLHSHILFFACFLAIFVAVEPLSASESAAKSPEGLERIQLITDLVAITPGKAFTVGLVLEPMPGFHTYWRGPGNVGVATSLSWDLPDGFTAGEIEWPLPEKTDMAGISANGYRSKACLLVEIQPPAEFAAQSVTLKAQAAWMACSTSCHPGLVNLELTLPVHKGTAPAERHTARSRLFESIRAAMPDPAPASWKPSIWLATPERVEMTLTIPGLKDAHVSSLEFFCDDMQVDSDAPLSFRWLNREQGKIRLKFARPTFAPEAPSRFSGLLRAGSDLPGLDSPWVEISLPWPEGTFSDE